LLAPAGILVPSLGLAVSTAVGVRATALAAGFVLLTWARVVSTTSLNGLHVGLVVPAFYMLFVSGWLERRGQVSGN